ncbi:MAG: hypothetical protein Q8930_01020 [Bacillota bacterium]|nr:hypothetical protein [Bacillota bacterium]
MSAYLGKIHHWLFNKIKYAEDIEKKIEKLASDHGIAEASEWKTEIQGEFGGVTGDEPLERIIDTSNIHGWLQNKIIGVESRQAAWITRLLSTNNSYMDALIRIFSEDGRSKGSEAVENYNIEKAGDIYRVLNDYILEGMPCDSVDKVVENREELFKWISTRCLHRTNWDAAGGDIKVFYELRRVWISNFVKALGTEFKYDTEYDGEMRINTISI